MTAQQQQAARAALEERGTPLLKKIEAMTEENEKLREKLALRQATLKRLEKLTLAATMLLDNVDSSADQTEMSCLSCLSRLDKSSAVNPTEDEAEEEDTAKLIVGKYLNQLLALVFNYVRERDGKLELVGLLGLAEELKKQFVLAEKEELIPVTEENKGWKEGVMLQRKILEAISGAGAPAGDEEDDEEKE